MRLFVICHPKILCTADWARIRSTVRMENVTETILSILIARRLAWNSENFASIESTLVRFASKWIYSLCCRHFDRTRSTVALVLLPNLRSSHCLNSKDILSIPMLKMQRAANIFCWLNHKSSRWHRHSGNGNGFYFIVGRSCTDFTFFHRFIESSRTHTTAWKSPPTKLKSKSGRLCLVSAGFGCRSREPFSMQNISYCSTVCAVYGQINRWKTLPLNWNYRVAINAAEIWKYDDNNNNNNDYGHSNQWL